MGIAVEQCVVDIEGISYRKNCVPPRPPWEIGRAGFTVVGAVWHGAADGLGGGGVVGFQQQGMTGIWDKLVVSITGVESRGVAFQWVEVGGRGGWGGGGFRRFRGRSWGSQRSFIRGGCASGKGEGDGEDEGDEFFHGNLLFLM